MRIHVAEAAKPRASFSFKKVVAITIIFMMMMGMMGVLASNDQVKSVKITLSSGYEMKVMTTSTRVSKILKENNVTILDGETVTPDLNSDIDDNNRQITITKEKNEEKQEKKPEDYFSEEDILKSYSQIVEKIVKVEETIPFETITKDVSGGSSTTTDRVVTAGVNGLKEVTYKIKYQNGTEIEKTVLSETIIREKVDKVVEVRTMITSRGSVVRTGAGTWSYSEEDMNLLYAITRQEAGSSYEASLAVITCACNRAESAKWRRNGTDPLSQYCAKNQFCYSIDRHWVKYLGGNVPEHVKRAVKDALNGKRNHNYLSFRGYYTNGSVNIGGNYYFSPM